MGICERMLRLDAPAGVVWAWMSDPGNLLGLDLLHAAVSASDTELRPGALITIDYEILGLYRGRHQARIRDMQQPYYVAFSVDRSPGGDGRDPFPHSQSFRVVPLDECSCIVVNCVAGHLVFPGSAILGERLFQRYLPAALDDQNRLVAVGCGALAPSKLSRPPGLVGVLLAVSTRLGRRSTRADLIDRVRTDRAMAYRAPTSTDPEPVDPTDQVPRDVTVSARAHDAFSVRADGVTERAAPR
jgi:hypothetical protein